MDAGSLVVSFARTHDAFAFEDAARASGLSGRLIPLPTGIAATCGLAWLVPPAAPVPDAVAGLTCAAVHRFDGTGYVPATPSFAPGGPRRHGDAPVAWTPEDPGRRPLHQALGLPPDRAQGRAGGALTITLVGAGGKTTLAHAIADELAASGARVAITTTTHMTHEEGAFTDARLALPALQHDESALKAPNTPQSTPSTPLSALSSCSPGRTVLVGTPAAGGKIGALPDADLALLREASDYLIVEGDGSRRLPFKVPAAHEPVVPAFTDRILLVMGLTALDRPLGEVSCRLPEAGELLAMTETDAAARVLDPALAAALLLRGYVEQPRLAPWIGRTTIVLNQADTPGLDAAGRELAEVLRPLPVLLTSNRALFEHS